MPAVPLGVSSFHRTEAKTPAILLRNVFLEKDPTNEVDGIVRLQRAGLVRVATVGDGPGRGIFQQDGTFNGDFVVASGAGLYRVRKDGSSTLLGTIGGGSTICQFAGSATRVICVCDGVAYSTDGAGVTAITMPDGESVSSVAYINGYFLLTVEGSQRFFWLAPGDTDPDALNFASAENNPDNLVAVFHVYDELWLFGTESIEVWSPTGDLNLPFERINGRLYEKGCASRDTVCKADNTLFWVGSDGIAYRGGDQSPTVIGDASLFERIRQNDGGALKAWTYTQDGHLFYVLSIGSEGTFAYDVSTGMSLPQFSTYGRETWRAHLGKQIDARNVYALDDTDGTLWKLDTSASNDDGEPMVREVTGGTAVLGQPQNCYDFEARVQAGYAPIAGEASDPILLLRWSDDFGNTWTSWKERKVGKQGQYKRRSIWTRLGSIEPPGRVWQLRFTDDTQFRLFYARINEAFV